MSAARSSWIRSCWSAKARASRSALRWSAGALVTAKVVKHGRADKIRIVKFRRRKHHRKEMGHRQHYTEIEIVGITGASDKKHAAKTEKTAEE